MHPLLGKLALAGSALMVGAFFFAAAAPVALGACGHPGGSFARMVAPDAETIVLARVGSTRSERVPIGHGPTRSDRYRQEPTTTEVTTFDVLRVLRGNPEPTVEAPADILSDCLQHTSNLGDRIVLAFVPSSLNGAYVGSWHEDRQGRWWHHQENHPSLAALLRALDVLPNTATAGTDETPRPASDFGYFAIWLVTTLAMTRVLLRQLASRRRGLAGT